MEERNQVITGQLQGASPSYDYKNQGHTLLFLLWHLTVSMTDYSEPCIVQDREEGDKKGGKEERMK